MGEHKYDYALSGKKLFAFALPKQLEFLQKKKNSNCDKYEHLELWITRSSKY